MQRLSKTAVAASVLAMLLVAAAGVARAECAAPVQSAVGGTPAGQQLCPTEDDPTPTPPPSTSPDPKPKPRATRAPQSRPASPAGGRQVLALPGAPRTTVQLPPDDLFGQVPTTEPGQPFGGQFSATGLGTTQPGLPIVPGSGNDFGLRVGLMLLGAAVVAAWLVQARVRRWMIGI